MKKLIPVLVLLCLVLAACGTAPPPVESLSPSSSESIASSTVTQPPEEIGTNETEYVNPYNSQTAVTDDYIFTETRGAIYRIDRESSDSQVFISEETHGLLVGYSYQTIATVGNDLYFLSPNHLLDRFDPASIETYEIGLYRANVDDGSVEKVGTVAKSVYTLQGIGDYLVMHHVGDMPGIANIPEMDPDEAFKIFLPDTNTSVLDELVYSSLDEEEKEGIMRRVYLYQETARLEERLFDEEQDIGFGPVVRADDAYYYLSTFDTMRFFKADFFNGKEEEIIFNDDTSQYMQNAGWAEIVNYDDDWLYIKTYTDLVKIRKDGSEHIVLAENNISQTSLIDIVDGHVYFQGADGFYYFDNIALDKAV